eukprot:scaffold56706_cov54-Attheya_sp.AAC.5
MEEVCSFGCGMGHAGGQDGTVQGARVLDGCRRHVNGGCGPLFFFVLGDGSGDKGNASRMTNNGGPSHTWQLNR